MTLMPPPAKLVSPSELTGHGANVPAQGGMCPATPVAEHSLEHCKPCETAAKHKPVKHVRHVKPIKHVKPHVVPKPPLPLPERVIIQQPPPQPLPPLPVVDPCDGGLCGEPCEPHAQIDLQGPCADPLTPCVQRVSFNEEGIATKVVLEPQMIQQQGPYFEIHRVPEARMAGWNEASRNITTASNTVSDTTEVSLVVPFVKPVFEA
jgi:hypothetical protein